MYGGNPVRGCRRNSGQRWAIYIVISMPYRKSIASGVSHFMARLLALVGRQCSAKARAAKGDHHETGLMIFMSGAGVHPLRGAL